MFNFDVKDLNDGDTAARIVKAVMAVDDKASVSVCVATQGVAVRSAAVGARELLGALCSAGFAAALVEPKAHLALAASAAPADSPRRLPRKIPFEPDGTEFDSGDA